MKCATCDASVRAMTCEVDPRRAVLRWIAGCGHLLTEDEARNLWRRERLRCEVPPINGASLAAAERARQIHEEGHTPELDAKLTEGQLAWAVWCLLDRAGAKNPTEQAPLVWPLPRSQFPQDKSPLRFEIIAAALLLASIDRRLAAGEKP